jgi:hypothetical protein
LASEKAFRKGSDEYHRELLQSEDLVDCVKPRASVSKLNVGENKARTALERRADRLGVSSSDRCYVVPQLFDKSLYIQGDERFILDDQHRRADLSRNFVSSAVN